MLADEARIAYDSPVIPSQRVLELQIKSSLCGDDFRLTVGQDFSIGYLGHDAEYVRLYIEESFTFWLLSPQAAVPLVFSEAPTAA